MDKDSLLKDIEEYCRKTVAVFHEKRLKKVSELKLTEVLKRKNPYLYKAKGMETAGDIVKSLVEDYLSSHEETIFGNWLEELAIFVCGVAFNGKKSGVEGIDLEFERDNKRYFVSIKSGPNWGNSSQIKQMVNNFKQVSKIVQQGRQGAGNIIFVEGCCYGRCGIQNKGFYYKYCGKDFWELISGIETLYVDIVEPIGVEAKKKNEEYMGEYNKLLNRLTKEFTELFCKEDGSIDWKKLVDFASLKEFRIKRSGRSV